MIKCCIFDLDGTLLDTITTIRYYVNLTLTQYGIENITPEECRRFVGRGARNLMEQVFASRGVSDRALFDEAFAFYNAAYDSAPTYLTKPYDGIHELVDRLSAAGIRLAVVSNKPDFSTRVAVSEFFSDRFDIVRGGREGVPLKPAPDALREVIRELDATEDTAAYVGDSEVDVVCAKNLGPALPITVDWGFRTSEELLAAGAERIYSDPAAVGDTILEF